MIKSGFSGDLGNASSALRPESEDGIAWDKPGIGLAVLSSSDSRAAFARAAFSATC
jgi:hypothetical protein